MDRYDADYFENIIKAKAERNKQEAMHKEERQIVEWNEAYNAVASLQRRVGDVLRLAKACVKNNIKIPEARCGDTRCESAKPWGYNAEFIAEGWAHNTGIYDRGQLKYECMAIINGGACGDIDLMVSEEEIWGQHHKEVYVSEARIQDLRKFAKQFPEFESAFYKWIQSLEE